MLHRFPDVERPPSLPRLLERALFAVLAGVGKVFGVGPEAGEGATKTANRCRSAT